METLAVEHVSGVLEIDGSPAGSVYFDQGQITFARASWVPDLSTRLRGALRPTAQLRELLRGGDRADHDIGTVLVRDGYLTRDGLQEILRSVVVDTLMVLTAPLPGETSVSDIRFQAPGSHWAGDFCRLDVDSVRAEVTGRAERIARYDLAWTTPVTLCDLDEACAVMQREQWELACIIDRPLSAQDLAWRHGVALYEAIERVGALVQAGLCAVRADVVPPPRSPAALPRGPGSAPAMLPAATLPQRAPGGHMPRRDPGEHLPPRDPSRNGWPAGATVPGGGELTPAAPEVLRRVLDGLKNLS